MSCEAEEIHDTVDKLLIGADMAEPTKRDGVVKFVYPPVSDYENDAKNRAAIVEALNIHGWTSDIAGADYDKAVEGLVKAYRHPRLGMIVSGEYGCGKTSFFKAIMRKVNFTEIDCTLPESVRVLDYNEHMDTVDYILNTSVFIDDLGAENLVSNYGVKVDTIGDFICRYHLKGKKRLFITTNLRGEELLSRYGGRVFSRLKDLCIPVRFDGKDKRTWTL